MESVVTKRARVSAAVATWRVPLGRCIAQPEGHADEACIGEHPACFGRCDAEGQCAFPGPSDTDPVVCETSCDGGEDLAVQVCNGAGGCRQQTEIQSCQGGRCIVEGTSAACDRSCLEHDECSGESACDRGNAHATGIGQCIDPVRIAGTLNGAGGADPEDNIDQAIDAIVTTGKPYLLLLPGNYNQSVSIPLGKGVRLIGLQPLGATTGLVSIRPPSAEAGIDVEADATLYVQGLQVQGGADGILCRPAGTNATAALTAVDVQVNQNSGMGLDALRCQLTVRRSNFWGNAAGGIRADEGTTILDSNLIRGNGTLGDPSGSLFGGVEISNSNAVTVRNNSIINNLSRPNAAAGLECIKATFTAENSIVFGNAGGSQSSDSCSFSHSAVEGLDPTGPTNIDENPMFDANFRPQNMNYFDAGTTTPWMLDYLSEARTQGVGPDIGAIEVQ